MTNRLLVIALVTIMASFTVIEHAYALQKSRPLPIDSRLRVITYHPEGIHHYTGYFDYQASILLEDGETVETVAMGVTSGWYINPVDNRIFIKPISNDPQETDTNMLMITNRRTYHFILQAAEADSINDPNLVWETRFTYPDNEDTNLNTLKTFDEPNLDDPDTNYNFNYSVSGSDYIAPIKVFDDGDFTFFEFSKESDLPAFFLVDSEGREAMVNYRINGNYVVIERVSSQYTLRHGSDVACIFNESRPLRRSVNQRVE